MKKPLLLISNDDSITSPFLPFFAQELSKVADIVIVVPATEKSWIGRAYSRHSKISVEEVDFYGFKTYTVSGTPSDCVNIALSHICKKPDAIVSGINIGQNIAMPLLWSSGTFAAAVEGASWGFPAFAFSMRLEGEFYDVCRIKHNVPEDCRLLENIKDASKTSAEFVIEKLSKHKFELGDIFNVNYPIKYTKQVQLKECVPARAKSAQIYHKNDDDDFEFKYVIKPIESEQITDFSCLEEGLACFSKINIYK